MIHNYDSHLYKNLQVVRSHNLDGILKFTPRDFAEFKPSQAVLSPGRNQFGFQGFPANNFEKGKTRTSVDQNEAQQSPRGVPHFMGKSRHHGEGKEFQYGSDGVNQSQPNPRRTNTLASKTSAELHRFRQQQAEAEADIQAFKQEQRQRLQLREDEKRQDLEMLKSYNPWGKPGGGAPRGDDNKLSKLDDKELFQKEVTSPRKEEFREEYGDFHSYFNRPGHGAPLRTDSGALKTQLKGDHTIRFQDSQKGRQVHDTEIRYQAPTEVKQQYHEELERQVQNKTLDAHERRLAELRQETEMLQKYQPFGKPGAGAPNKSRSAADRLETVEDDDNLRMEDEEARAPPARTNSEAEIYDPWGKGAGHPIRNKYGDVQRFKYSDSRSKEPFTNDELKQPIIEDGNSLDVGSSRGGGGAPLKTDSGNIKVKLPITMRRNEKGDTSIRDSSSRHRPSHLHDDPELAIYDPWGKGGNGAPLKDTSGNVKTNVYGRLKEDTGQKKTSADPRERQKANQEYLITLQKEMDERKLSKSREKSAEQDMAAIMKRGQVGRPRRDPLTGLLTNQHLGTSDVTKEQTSERRQATENSQEYHTELQKAATQREHIRQLDRLRSNHEWKKHQNSMNDFWGKPGAGAPTQTTKKINLESSLFAPRKEQNDFYNKNLTPAGQRPYNYIRNTVNSMHNNQYEFPVSPKRQPKKEYNLMTPYATVGSDDI